MLKTSDTSRYCVHKQFFFSSQGNFDTILKTCRRIGKFLVNCKKLHLEVVQTIPCSDEQGENKFTNSTYPVQLSVSCP